MKARGPKSDKEWADAIRKAVHELREETQPDGTVQKVRALNLLAKNLVTAGIDGDMAAMQEIGNRLDGRPKQSIEADIAVRDYVARLPEISSDVDQWASRHTPTIQ